MLLFILLAGCDNSAGLAPVVELKWQPRNPYQTVHTVRRGETLYAVAFRYDQDFRQLAAINHLYSPYTLRVGQMLKVKADSGGYKPVRVKSSIKPIKGSHYPKQSSSTAKFVRTHKQNWLWPIHGRIATQFIPQQGKKGIDIAGKKGDLIRAASHGIVAYAGSGLSGYGNLIIIKHDNQLLTAYGNNSRNRVKEGQRVKAGQVIAEIGIIDRHFWGVHFEIRKAGKPVSPLNYLQKG
ncbi:peptidoglycan DD-metalloendopeptidase family protein [Legionella fairfieldensis]|uniref:peptidoglycan DD-metalloendopeptidase family protein n=1 Tax=Legionella fairfieldensis TaxID=45064 RepID=UPI001F5FBAA5|nr:peptidoglycan DD-metalloendopeptidase family protein [Legionella fairfieldensis]